jgi:hypothetical protein
MRKRLAFGMLLALCAPTLTFLRPALAAPVLTPPTTTAPPTPTAIATGDTNPFTFSWEDTADGRVGTSDQLATQIHDVFAGATYVVLDNHQIQVGQVTNGQLTPAFTLNEEHTSDGNFYVVHVLTKNNGSSTLLDGTIQRNPQDPTQGSAILTLVLTDSQGNIATTHIEQSLAFQKPAA